MHKAPGHPPHKIPSLRSFFGNEPPLGWLLNALPTSLVSAEKTELSGLELFFLRQDGTTFKAKFRYSPYFYVACRDPWHKQVTALLEREQARARRDYKTADVLRDTLEKHGVYLDAKENKWHATDGRTGAAMAQGGGARRTRMQTRTRILHNNTRCMHG